jgi:hypothetical protein
MAGRYGNVDYAALTKRAFAVGAALFALGLLGELAISSLGLSVPNWEQTLLVDAEIAGVLVMLLSPFVFGIFMPLTD